MTLLLVFYLFMYTTEVVSVQHSARFICNIFSYLPCILQKYVFEMTISSYVCCFFFVFTIWCIDVILPCHNVCVFIVFLFYRLICQIKPYGTELKYCIKRLFFLRTFFASYFKFTSLCYHSSYLVLLSHMYMPSIYYSSFQSCTLYL